MAEGLLLGVLTNAVGNLTSEIIRGGFKAAVYYLQEVGIEPNDYSELLKDAARMLSALKDDNERRIRQLQNHTKTTSMSYNNWRATVPDIVSDLKDLIAKCEGKGFLFSPNPDKKVKFYLGRAYMFLDQGHWNEGFLVDQPPKPVVKIDSVSDITKFATLKRPLLEDILFLLSDEEVKTIVIWGPLGVGKTTIMRYLYNREEVAAPFEEVIWIKASEERTMEKLKERASLLHLNLQGTETDRQVAGIISEKLKTTKCLIFLEDVRGVISDGQLEHIGVPDKILNCSKMVLTTENRRVCIGMESVREIKVETLNQHDGQEMFKQIVTDKKIKTLRIEKVAELVAEECGGLPLVIKIVANCFKCKNSAAEWKSGLEKLRNGSTDETQYLTQVHAFLKFCYQNLRDENTKRCFLYGALHPADTKISTNYLVMCWAAEGLLGNVDGSRTFRNACDQGYETLYYLTDVSLLQKGERMEHVQVNNVVRQVALHISSEDVDNEFLIGEQTETSPIPQGVSVWEQTRRIFMINANLEEVPKLPRCSKLLSLLLQGNSKLTEIPRSFFEKMQKLLVLNLCETGIMSLPRSLKKMTGLKALLLNDCESLTDLPSQMGELCFLEVLDIRGCKVIFIPSSIGKLVQLRCLRVSYYKPTVKKTCCKVISCLLKLEELVIDVDMIFYERWCTEATDVIEHVASLKRLTSLKICFPKLEDLGTLMKRRPEWRDRQLLSPFWSSIGCQNRHPHEILDHCSCPIDRYLRYNYDGSHIGSSISNMFPETDALELIGHNNISCFSDFMQTPRLDGVVGCLVEQCSEMVTIVGGNYAGGANILRSLVQLHLRNLPDLKSIFKGTLSEGSLSELQTITVEHCPLLTEISSNGLIQQLPKLTRLTIKNCDEIEQLIQGSSGSGAMPNLEVLELVDMGKLEIICADESLAWPKLKKLQIYQCEKLKRLPFNRENAAGLKMIKGEQKWWDNLSNEFKEHFQSFAILRSGV